MKILESARRVALACLLLVTGFGHVCASSPEFVSVTPDGRKVIVTVFNDNVVKVSNLPKDASVPESASVVASPANFTGQLLEAGPNKVITTASGLTVTVDGINGSVVVVGGADRLLSDSGIRTNADGLNTMSLRTTGRCSYYGAGERGYSFNLDGDTLVMYNKQNYGYAAGQERIKQMNITMPLIISSNGYAVLFDDYAAANMIVTDTEITYQSESPDPVSYYFINGAGSLASVTREYTALTGRQDLPPFWALGYITSKYGYRTQAETVGVIDTLRRNRYPVDGVVLDLYWYGKEQDMGRLEWEPEQWPDHRKMLADLKTRGVNTVIISQPYVLRNGKALDNYNTLSSQGMFVADSVGNPHEVKIWVGEGGMFDMSNPATRQWLRERYKLLTDEGVSGWWGDLGEPEVHPETGIHANGKTTRLYHNQYGNDWSSIIYNLFKEEYPETRLMTMMRGGTAGLQRYDVFPWSTDVSRSWGGLQPQVTIMLNSGLSGLAYMSHDVGGFAVDENNPVDPELYVRWLQLGLFSPILRTHSQQMAEPFKYPEFQDIIHPLILERYRWLPYNYTLAYQNASEGQPLVRPLNYYTPGQSAYDDITDQYLWGRDVMVAPVLEQGATERRIVFPSGEWVDYNHPATVYCGGDTVIYPAPLAVLPLFVRAGAFIPQADYSMKHTGEYRTDRYAVKYFPVDGVDSEYEMYEDDRTSATSLERDAYSIITFKGSATSQQIGIDIEAFGTYEGAPQRKSLTFDVQRIDSKPSAVTVNGKKWKKWKYDSLTRTLAVTVDWNVASPLSIVIDR